MGRGIVATIYFRLAQPMTEDALRDAYVDFYEDEPFVRVLPKALAATNRNVRLSNFCDVSVHLPGDGRTAVVVAAIDNMVKGSAGQAIQSMNIALGLDEKRGHSHAPARVLAEEDRHEASARGRHGPEGIHGLGHPGRHQEDGRQEGPRPHLVRAPLLRGGLLHDATR